MTTSQQVFDWGAPLVLVIYTGGTFGMNIGQYGYKSVPNFLAETLASQFRFNDPGQNSPYSVTKTINSYCSESNFQRSRSFSGTRIVDGDLKNQDPLNEVRVPVRSSKIPGNSFSSSASEWIQITTESNLVAYEAYVPTLITPNCFGPDGTLKKKERPIRYAILEWGTLLDSSHMGAADWIRIVSEIQLNYSLFQGFVVLHGTDTMAHTACALSFLLEYPEKPVVITGAQVPLSSLRNDAVGNFLGSLIMAGHHEIPESSVYFNRQLFRGNRVVKISTDDLDAFSSPKFPALAQGDVKIVVDWPRVLRKSGTPSFRAHKEMSKGVVMFELYPDVEAETIEALTKNAKGMVLKVFGAGNAPPELESALTEACSRGVVIVAVSQCLKGRTSKAYEACQTLVKAGVIFGGDINPDCAVIKLRYLLTKKFTPEVIRKLMSTSIRGELSAPTIDSPIQDLNELQQRLARLVSGNSCSDSINSKFSECPTNNVNPVEPLHLACWNGDTEWVRVLMDVGAFIDVPDIYGHTALFYAAKQGHTETVELLINAGSTLSTIDEYFAKPFIREATTKGDSESASVWKIIASNKKKITFFLDATPES